MNKRVLTTVGVTSIIVAVTCMYWIFSTVNIPADEVIGANYKRTFRVIGTPMLTKVSDASNGTDILWYNNDHGPIPTKIERVNGDEWIITLRRNNR